MKVIEIRNNPVQYWKKYGWKNWKHKDVIELLQELHDVYDSDDCAGDNLYDLHRFAMTRIGLELVLEDLEPDMCKNPLSFLTYARDIVGYACTTRGIDKSTARAIDKIWHFLFKLEKQIYEKANLSA